MSVAYYVRVNGRKVGGEMPRLGPVYESVKQWDVLDGQVVEAVEDSAEEVRVILRREGKSNG